MLKIEQFISGPLQNNVLLLIDEDTKECAVIDPSIGIDHVHDYIEEQGLTVKLILLTHGHFDHVFTAQELIDKHGAKLALHTMDIPTLNRMKDVADGFGIPGAGDPPRVDIELEHGSVIKLGDNEIEVRHTPGHSPGQVALIIEGNAIVGDTLFKRGIGRYDLPGSDYEALMKSIQEQLYTLEPETIVWPGHGPTTTIGEEIKLNPYIGDSARFKQKF